jgi:hypothetical protein
MLKANTSFFADGRLVNVGELVAATDPIVKGREVLFDRTGDTVVEEATAVPGVKRTTKRRTTKPTGE